MVTEIRDSKVARAREDAEALGHDLRGFRRTGERWLAECQRSPCKGMVWVVLPPAQTYGGTAVSQELRCPIRDMP